MLDTIINWRFAAKALAWGAAMLGVLQLRHLSGSWSYALCGPWGCGPTLESVAACHAAWIVLLVPAVVVIVRRLSVEAVAMCGRLAIAVGVLGLAGVALWMGVRWYPEATSQQRLYVLQTYLYTVACLVEIPLTQLVFVGGILRYIGRDMSNPAHGAAADPADSMTGEVRMRSSEQ